MRRPGPWQWLRYAVGGGLPLRHRMWVLHDVTTRTWVLRHLARSAVQILPVAVVLFLALPGDPTVRLAAIAMGTLVGFAYSAAFVEGATEHRAVKAGYPPGYAAQVRRRRRGEPDD